MSTKTPTPLNGLAAPTWIAAIAPAMIPTVTMGEYAALCVNILCSCSVGRRAENAFQSLDRLAIELLESDLDETSAGIAGPLSTYAEYKSLCRRAPASSFDSR